MVYLIWPPINKIGTQIPKSENRVTHKMCFDFNSKFNCNIQSNRTEAKIFHRWRIWYIVAMEHINLTAKFER